jgi:hypothetical protein
MSLFIIICYFIIIWKGLGIQGGDGIFLSSDFCRLPLKNG